MTERSASASIVVEVEPLQAFAIFTDDIDAWWVRGPVNFFDPGRAVAMRIEPGVGGRVLEVYEEDVLELGRITAWEPGALLAYGSLVDDTEVTVRFETEAGATRVTIVQRVLPGGERGLFFWPTSLRWLGRWLEAGAPAGPRELARVSLALRYERPAAAARWLARAFGLGSWHGVPGEREEPDWIELHHGNVALLLFTIEAPTPAGAPATHVPWLYVDDLERHLEHARAAGATIVSPIEETGFRSYAAEDLEGRQWRFVQARPTMR